VESELLAKVHEAPAVETTTPAVAHETSPVASTVPAEVIASQEKAHIEPEAAANPEAVVEKSAVESELLAKVPEAPAAETTPAITTAGALESSAVATAVPAAVIASQHEAHVGPEAASNAEAVVEKSAVEQELLSKVHETPAAPATSQEAPAVADEAHPVSTIVPAAAGGALAGAAIASHTKNDSVVTPSSVEQINKPTGANDVEAATYTYSSTPVGIGASTTQADVNSIANLSARPEGEGVSADAPSVGVIHGHAIHDIEQDAGAANVGAVASTAAAHQLNQPRADNDIAEATVVERSYPVGTTSTAEPTLAAEPGHSSALPIVAAATAGVAGAGLAAHSTTHGSTTNEAASKNEGVSAADTVAEPANDFPAPATVKEATPAALPVVAAAGVVGGHESHAEHSSKHAEAPAGTAKNGPSAADTVAEPVNDFPAPATVKEATPAALPVVAAAGVATGDSSSAAHSSSSNPIQTTTNTYSSPHLDGASAPITTGPHISDTVNRLDPSVPLASESASAQGSSSAGVTALPLASESTSAQGASHTGVTALPHMSDRHERKLQEAREEEAAIGGDRGEKEHGILHKILHPFHHDKKEENVPPTTVAGEVVDRSSLDAPATATSTSNTTSSTVSAPAMKAPVASLDPVADKAGIVIDPRTGLPTDPLKTHTSTSQEPTSHSESVEPRTSTTLAGGPDWEAINKAQ
jgi:hypothetical protein